MSLPFVFFFEREERGVCFPNPQVKWEDFNYTQFCLHIFLEGVNCYFCFIVF